MPTEWLCLKLDEKFLSIHPKLWKNPHTRERPSQNNKMEVFLLFEIKYDFEYSVVSVGLFWMEHHFSCFCAIANKAGSQWCILQFHFYLIPNQMPSHMTSLGFIKTEEKHDHRCYCHSEVNIGQGRKLSNVLRTAEYSYTIKLPNVSLTCRADKQRH